MPPNAQGISFGTLLAGGGTAWVSHLRLEPVADSVRVTAARRLDAYAARPCGPVSAVNLDFAAPPG